MTRDECTELFRQDENGRFVNLIIPSMDGYPEMNLIGKKQLELNRDEVISLKLYSARLYELIDEN